MGLRDGFSFWRLSWGRWAVVTVDLGFTLGLGLGLGLPIRDATIGFGRVDGSLSEANGDIGPSPSLEFLGEAEERFLSNAQ